MYAAVAPAPDAHTSGGYLSRNPPAPMVLDRFEHHADARPAQLSVDGHRFQFPAHLFIVGPISDFGGLRGEILLQGLAHLFGGSVANDGDDFRHDLVIGLRCCTDQPPSRQPTFTYL